MTDSSTEPRIIQGGMGVGVSDWRLARAVASRGQLGVVSGTALDVVVAHRLQNGDPGEHMRRAMERFPDPAMTRRILDRFYIPGGKPDGAPYKSLTLCSASPSVRRQELMMVANFVEVSLAKEGHDGLVGINFLEKIQFPTLPSLYGAMLADVDYVLMGAGIPREIPGVLDHLAEHRRVTLRLNVQDAAPGDDHRLELDPGALLKTDGAFLKRPKFLAIIASTTLANALAKRATGKVDGFVVEGPTAGGHIAPPRGPAEFNPRGEPAYGPRDEVDLETLKKLGLPFWLAGSFGSPERLRDAMEKGASGIQVGTAFAFCEESGIDPEIKSSLFDRLQTDEADVFTDPSASPAGFPFKVVKLDGSLSEQEVYEARPRRCNFGYLRTVYASEDGSLSYRCPAEPVDTYLKKGGEIEEMEGRLCLCNGLLATIGLADRSANRNEPPLVTAGQDLALIKRFLKDGESSYTAASVLDYLLEPSP